MPLLAQLARYDWFTKVGEPAITQFLNGLLDEPSLNQAITALIARRSGRDIFNVVQWRPEQIQADRGRTDLEGLDPEGRPRIIVEVKFGALLTAGQMVSYLSSQRMRLREEASVLVALIPEYRRGECERELAVARQAVGAGPDRTVTLSWDEWLDAWDAADVADDVRCDLAQLRGLCAALSGLAIPPFEREPGPDWAEREADLLALLRLVTRRLMPEGARLTPQGPDEFSWYTGRRYVGPVRPYDAAVSVGLAGPWAAEGDAALWLRFHKDTPGFLEIERRVRVSKLSEQARDYAGHVWLPVKIPVGPAGQQLAEAIAISIRESLRVLDLELQ